VTAARCRTCKHFRREKEAPVGSCTRWLYGYSMRPGFPLPAGEVIVEDDEGWGAMMHEAFGCVLHESNESNR
jgi:hypothetical protein